MDEPSFHQEPSPKRSMSLGVGAILNASNDDETGNQRNQPHVYYNRYAQPPPHNEAPIPVSGKSSTSNQGTSTQASISSAGRHSLMHESPIQRTATSKASTHPLYESQIPPRPADPETGPVIPSQSVPEYPTNIGARSRTGLDVAPEQTASISTPEAPGHRVRYREVPIFAQSARQKGRGDAQINGQRKMIGKSPSLINQQPPTTTSHPPVKQEGDGHNTSHMDAVPSQLDPTGILGPWEPTITNVIPAEELTRGVMDYLIQTVVQMNGVAFGPAGGSTTGRGALVEIEAKIGQIIDKDTNDRLRLPVMTECMLSRTDPNLRTAFRSSMTVAQHSRLNGFLNNAFLSSKPAPAGEPPKKPRVPLDYVHTYETDAFYDVSQNALNTLPPAVQNYLDRRSKPKVRITTNQRTNQVTAKIIKVRISDVEIYSPQTPFDWRVSVSLEVNYDGDMRDLVETTERRSPDRNKDRVSYKHSHYQIDLTQVKTAEVGAVLSPLTLSIRTSTDMSAFLQASSAIEKEHELEVEVSSAAVREQGLLVLQNQPNKYEELIKGFVDNVRTLVRHCKN